MKLAAPDLTKLFQTAREARNCAIATYSKFLVGAALQTEDGKIFKAGNIECSSYGLTLCAERVALFKALSEGVRHFAAIAVTAGTDDFCTPCGACRQVLADYAPNLDVYLLNNAGEYKHYTLKELLPDAFDGSLL